MNEREEEVLNAAARIICIVRALHAKGNRSLRDEGMLDRCLYLYDSAVRRMNARSTYERLKDRDNLNAEQPEEPKEPQLGDRSPPLPEPVTHSIYRAFYAWQDVVQDAKRELDGFRKVETNEDAPPSPEMARAYKRFYKAHDILGWLGRAIEEAMADYVDDATEEGSIKMNFRVAVVSETEASNEEETP